MYAYCRLRAARYPDGVNVLSVSKMVVEECRRVRAAWLLGALEGGVSPLRASVVEPSSFV